MSFDLISDLFFGLDSKNILLNILSEDYNACVKFQNSSFNNTFIILDKQFIFLNYLPKLSLNPKTQLVLSNQTFIDIISFYDEIQNLRSNGIEVLHRLFISKNANIITIFDVMQDKHTLSKWTQGFDFSFQNKINKKALIFNDLLNFDIFKEKILNLFSYYKDLLNIEKTIIDNYLERCLEINKFLKHRITDTKKIIQNFIKQEKNILFESDYGIMQDINFGYSPFVSKQNTGIYSLMPSIGINIHEIKHYGCFYPFIIMPKDYFFYDGLENEDKEFISKKIINNNLNNFKICYLDLLLLKKSLEISEINEIYLLFPLQLTYLKQISIIYSYKINNNIICDIPENINELKKSEYLFEKFNFDKIDTLNNINQYLYQFENYLNFIKSNINQVKINLIIYQDKDFFLLKM